MVNSFRSLAPVAPSPALPSDAVPVNAGEVVICKTDDTQITFKMKGEDEVVREATITLS